jgi:hypothetical protein
MLQGFYLNRLNYSATFLNFMAFTCLNSVLLGVKIQ